MNDIDKHILDLLSAVGRVRSIIRRSHVEIEKAAMVTSVCAETIPSASETGTDTEYADSGVTINLSITAELASPRPPDKQAYGASILLRHSKGKWIAEYELGWCGRDIGWDSIDEESWSIEVDTIAELIEDLVPASERLLTNFTQYFRDRKE